MVSTKWPPFMVQYGKIIRLLWPCKKVKVKTTGLVHNVIIPTNCWNHDWRSKSNGSMSYGVHKKVFRKQGRMHAWTDRHTDGRYYNLSKWHSFFWALHAKWYPSVKIDKDKATRSPEISRQQVQKPTPPPLSTRGFYIPIYPPPPPPPPGKIIHKTWRKNMKWEKSNLNNILITIQNEMTKNLKTNYIPPPFMLKFPIYYLEKPLPITSKWRGVIYI